MIERFERAHQPHVGDSGQGDVAYRHRPAKPSNAHRPGLLFCGGFHSNMDGGKANFLDEKCRQAGRQFTRFDYRGHGLSDCAFASGTIGDWYEDTKLIFDNVTDGPQIVIGSSMGAWMALMLARDRKDRVAGLVLIAPAPDFPRRLMMPALPDDALHALETRGKWDRPSEFEEDPYPITKRLIEESAHHELLEGPKIAVSGRAHILHGTDDEVVPTTHAERVLALLEATDVALTVIPGGDHRLSTDDNLMLLWNTIDEL